ncbi:class F sortase [Planomonospora sp. ID67723]|uniref:class F sortase n=1 Tax=Planomonospora sp. ID67723 TaxID=2738134 RepID=UPI0018C43CA1|nr:class F sortase [Planomonospora sp. ID67723]MBG0831640.1 class F sortase [Planomonospora sp. ID67723]
MATDHPPEHLAPRRAWIDRYGVLWIEPAPPPPPLPPPAAPSAQPARPWSAFTWSLIILGALAAIATPLAMAAAILNAAAAPLAVGPAEQPGTAMRLEPVPDAAQAASPPDATAAVLPRSMPVAIRIPAIGVSAPVRAVGLDADGAVSAPPVRQPNLTGWYKHGPTPGELGPAVILGHVDTITGPAVFARLRELAPGAVIEVVRRDGSTATFVVDGLEKASKRTFPTGRVYGRLEHAGLRLITCGGDFDHSARSYTDNVIVYAHLR